MGILKQKSYISEINVKKLRKSLNKEFSALPRDPTGSKCIT